MHGELLEDPTPEGLSLILIRQFRQEYKPYCIDSIAIPEQGEEPFYL